MTTLHATVIMITWNALGKALAAGEASSLHASSATPPHPASIHLTAGIRRFFFRRSLLLLPDTRTAFPPSSTTSLRHEQQIRRHPPLSRRAPRTVGGFPRGPATALLLDRAQGAAPLWGAELKACQRALEPLGLYLANASDYLFRKCFFNAPRRRFTMVVRAFPCAQRHFNEREWTE